MAEIPFVDDSTRQKAESKAQQLIPWLPDPYQCDECGAYCEPTTDFVEQQAMVMNIWQCPDCGARFYREEENPLTADMW